jgi:hypothetical protein
VQLSEVTEAFEEILDDEELDESKKDKPYPKVVMRVSGVDFVVGQVLYDEETDKVYILPA